MKGMVNMNGSVNVNECRSTWLRFVSLVNMNLTVNMKRRCSTWTQCAQHDQLIMADRKRIIAVGSTAPTSNLQLLRCLCLLQHLLLYQQPLTSVLFHYTGPILGSFIGKIFGRFIWGILVGLWYECCVVYWRNIDKFMKGIFGTFMKRILC